jgi:hypothetical protein
MGTHRIHMIWPEDLKSRVTALVGKRGTTDFVIQAVEEALLRASKNKPAPEPESAPEPEPIEEPEAEVEARPGSIEHIQQTYGLARASDLLGRKDIEVDF